ncbi:MAG: site-specific DNA-methyltransferase [Eubacteriales bacterium]
MIITDPPYNMQYSKGSGCFMKPDALIVKRLKKLINFDPDSIRFITELDIPSVYIFTSKTLLRPYLNMFEGYNQNVLVWCKTNPVPFTGGTFLPDVEYLLYFSKRGKVWNNSLKPMYTYSKYYVSKKEQGKDEAGNVHPTIKPLQFIEDKIRISSKPDGVVLDMFGGSGTTLIACEHTGRRCIMFEYEPEYCEVIINRWQKEIPIK